MVESRCGLLCSSCSYRKPCNCGGCIETGGHHFHGECLIAGCCQGKGYEHCGQCPDMPCSKLYAYSFLDREHGDNPPGARLQVLEKWAVEGCTQYRPLFLKAASIMKAAKEAIIATVDENGFPSASAISSIKTDGIKIIWFSTGLGSGKVKRLSKNNKCSVCYCDGKNNVTLQGTVEILTDPDIKRQLWVDWFINHFPGGVEDADYCILKFTAKKVVLWVDSQTDEFELSDIG